MFGSNPFGQSSSSPFGSQPAFGQSTSSSSPFASNPVGSTSLFGTQSGSSFFGSTTTGVFGGQSSSPLGSTSVIGAALSPAFAFGQSSIRPFGSQTDFEQNTNASSSVASNLFGSTSLFGTQRESSFFGSSITGVFGSQSSLPLGSTSVFGAALSPAFGSSTPAFGASSTSELGTTLFALKYNGGLVMGSDSRSTDSSNGRIISDNVIKVFELTDYMFISFTGRASRGKGLVGKIKTKLSEVNMDDLPISVCSYAANYAMNL